MTQPSNGGPADEPSRLPLADLRVIDCSTVLAGPHCARYLGDFGADVVKVERPGGDTTRAMGWRDPADDVTLWWKFLGRNKRSVVLDLKTTDDLDVMRRLCATADVLVENFRPGTLERLGLDPVDLMTANPPGRVRWAGRPLGADTADVRAEACSSPTPDQCEH